LQVRGALQSSTLLPLWTGAEPHYGFGPLSQRAPPKKKKKSKKKKKKYNFYPYSLKNL